jgi:hypothetical protein
MKRSIILLAIASLPLAACSGKGKPADDKTAKADATATDAAKPNPWASGSAAPAPEATKTAAKDAPAKEEHVNPWAKNPPPGSQPSAAASDKPKEKAASKPQPAMQ